MRMLHTQNAATHETIKFRQYSRRMVLGAFSMLVTLFIVSSMENVEGYRSTFFSQLQARNYEYTFEEYLVEYGKSYPDPQEYEARRALFTRRLNEVRDHNEDPQLSKLWKKGINAHSDLTDEELRSYNGYHRELGIHQVEFGRTSLGRTSGEIPAMDRARLDKLPTMLDWRKSLALTAVKDQGMCGGCWAFAATEVIESHWYLATGNLMDLSVQHIVQCTPNPKQCGGSGGCGGATPELAFDFVMTEGLPSEWTDSYQQYYNNKTLTCTKPKGAILANIDSYKRVISNSLIDVLEALQYGPLAVNIDASTLHSYESGIANSCDQQHIVLDHAVVLVGYGAEIIDGSSVPYWILRNSWGSDFGEDGYFRFIRELESPVCGTDPTPSKGTACINDPETPVVVCGTCGLLYDVVYPIVSPNEIPKDSM